MEVRPGYRQTEVGVIPDDWDVVQLGDLKPFVTSGSRGWASFYSERGEFFVRITNLSRESIYLDLTDCKFVELPPEAREGVRTQLNEYDVLISITADIGIVGYVDASVPLPAYINQHIALVRFDPATTSGKFVSYFLASEQPQKRFRATTDTGAKAGMSLVTVRKIQMALPSHFEQRAIAAALSDVDALLAGLDRLIAKKRGLKQAAMQQLLTCQTRLPGFHGEWDVKPLGALGTWKGGMTPSMQNPSYWDGGHFPWISSGDVKVSRLTDTNQHVTAWAVRHGAAVVVPANSIVLVTRSGILRKYLPVALAVKPMAINQDIKALIPNEALSSDFLLHTLTGCGDKILASCLKAGTTVESIEFPWLKSFTIFVPPRDEQLAIATALSDMDAELSALEARRDKTRALKQGMMQELLTGKTRLV
ncbi:MAG: restriction endonuclease subunit S [Betaproteobacteria bacterium]|nr:restriction endonuclease subunit S [Betaproteobacteria bacterium]